MKYIPTFEQFINEKYLYENEDALIAKIEDLDDDMPLEVDGPTVSMSIIKSIARSGADSKVKAYAKKQISDTQDAISRERDTLKKRQGSDDKEGIKYQQASLKVLDAHLAVYSAVGKGDLKGVASAMSKLVSLSKAVSRLEESYDYLYENEDALIAKIEDLDDDIYDYTDGPTVSMSIIKKIASSGADSSVNDYAKKQISITHRAISREKDALKKRQDSGDKEGIKYQQASIKVLDAHLAVYSAIGKGNLKGVASAMSRLLSLSKVASTLEESYDYLYEKNEFVVKAAERINKKGELTDNQQSDFDSHMGSAKDNIDRIEDYLRSLNKWDSDTPGHMELLDNEIEYAETKYRAAQYYHDAYLAASKGNVRKAATSIKKYRELEKTFNNFYKNSVKISKQYGISKNPWEFKL